MYGELIYGMRDWHRGGIVFVRPMVHRKAEAAKQGGFLHSLEVNLTFILSIVGGNGIEMQVFHWARRKQRGCCPSLESILSKIFSSLSVRLSVLICLQHAKFLPCVGCCGTVAHDFGKLSGYSIFMVVAVFRNPV